MTSLFCAALWPAKNSITLEEGDNDDWVTVSVLGHNRAGVSNKKTEMLFFIVALL